MLSYKQMCSYLRSDQLRLREIDIFQITCKWLEQDGAKDHAQALMSLIRFPLISPADLVDQVQRVKFMISNPELHKMVLAAFNYHYVPHSQPLASPSMQLRSYVTRLVGIGTIEYDMDNICSLDGIWASDVIITHTSLQNQRKMADLPTALMNMQVVTLNNFLYVLGGFNNAEDISDDMIVDWVLRYDPRFNCWFHVRSMKNKRAFFYAGALNNKIYAVGGRSNSGNLTTAEFYDPATNTWDLIASMPRSYEEHAGAVYGNYIYISGGYSGIHLMSDLLRYDPITNQWENMIPMLIPRSGHVMCATHDKLFVFGGLSLYSILPDMLTSEIYNPTTGQWTIISPMPQSNRDASCVVVDDSIYVLGGWLANGIAPQDIVSRFNICKWTWEEVGHMPPTLFGMGFCTLKIPF